MGHGNEDNNGEGGIEKTKQVAIRMDPELYEAVNQIAANLRATMAWVIRDAIWFAINHERWGTAANNVAETRKTQ